MTAFVAVPLGTILNTATRVIHGEAGANTLSLGLDTYLRSTDYGGIEINGAGSWQLTIDGGIQSVFPVSGHGEGVGIGLINYLSTVNSKITVGTEGTVAGDGQGIYSSVASDVVNSGAIVGKDGFGIHFLGQLASC